MQMPLLSAVFGYVLAGQPSLSVNSPSASAGNSANIVVSHSTGSVLAGLQFNLNFDPARGQPNLTQITSTSGATATCSRPGGSLTQFRCIFRQLHRRFSAVVRG